MIRMPVVAIVASLWASAALAQVPATPVPGQPSQNGGIVTRPGPVLDEAQIKARLQEEGYTEVSELLLQGPSYEAKAHKDGRRFNLTVDARTGAIRSRY